MNAKFELRAYYVRYIDQKKIQLPLIIQPTKEQLMNYLEPLKKNKEGTLTLRNDQEENHKPYKLTLYSDNHNYMVMFEIILPDGDIEVRTFNNGSGSKRLIPVLGEPFAEVSVVQDFDLVVRAFKEFLETGDISKDLVY